MALRSADEPIYGSNGEAVVCPAPWNDLLAPITIKKNENPELWDKYVTRRPQTTVNVRGHTEFEPAYRYQRDLGQRKLN
jgi:hypothetical protein